MKVWTALSRNDIEQIAESVGVTIYEHRDVGKAQQFQLRPLDERRDGVKKYQRRSASPFDTERKVHAVCWHGHRDFMRALLDRDPDARIKSGRYGNLDWRGWQDFEDRFEMSGYIDIGAPIMPVQMREACFCIEGAWDIDLDNRSRVRETC